MKFLSVCSGIEAASVAWGALGWEAVGFSEIEAFPSAVLRHHYPAVPNLGDMTKYQEWEIERPDVLVGGTPCQSFSVAGLRKGLADPRGNLALVYCGILDRFRPKWFVWENVPGVLSSGGGRDFGSFLGAVVELGYGFAYRVLDAQFFGVPQRRRRVFVVGYLGDWRPAAAVLFERESMRRDSAPSREKGQSVAPTVGTGAPFSRTGNGSEAEAVVEVCPTLRAGGTRTGGDRPPGTDVDTADSLIVQPYAVANCLTARMHKDINTTLDEGQTPVVGFNARQDPDSWVDRTGPLDTNGSTQAVAIGLDEEQNARVDGFGTLKARMDGGGFEGSVMTPAMAVRRLTPVECERLQGFPDNYTNIPWSAAKEAARKGISYEAILALRGMTLRGPSLEECPDGPRYKALGNSMAVPVMRWIGERMSAYVNRSLA